MSFIQATKHLLDIIEKWNTETVPKYKKYLESLMNEMLHNLGMSVADDDEPVVGDGQDDSDEWDGTAVCASFEMVFFKNIFY